VVGVVHCTHLPLACWQRPLVMFTDIDVVLLYHRTSKNNVEVTHLPARLRHHLPVQVELQPETLIETSCFLVLQMQLLEKSAFQ
jgi:hypothetical protein